MTKINYDNLFYNKEIHVESPQTASSSNGTPKTMKLSIELGAGLDKPDCKIGHFGYNFWLRTPYGIKGKKYRSAESLENAVEKVLKNNGFKIINWIEN